MTNTQSIGIVFGGPSPEHDISILTGLQTARLLVNGGREITCLYWSKTGTWFRVPVEAEAAQFLEPEIPGAIPVELTVPGGFVERRRRRDHHLSTDIIVNCCHGGPGEDGSLVAMLRLAGLRVTGPSPEAAALAMDKFATAALATHLGIDTIDTRLGTAIGDLAPPWVVKPRYGGSSLGIEVGVDDPATVTALASRGIGRGGLVVQPYLVGWTDLNIAVRSGCEPALSAIERPLREDDEILDYRTKYLRGQGGMESTPRELPAQVPDAIAERIRSDARHIVDAMGLTGLPRVDFLWDGADRVVLCEVNAIPGALGLYLWEAIGVSRHEVLAEWVEQASNDQPPRPHWAATADGSALRMAGSIASKLSF